MSSLEPQSPLMSPVDWQGQTYYTSQCFHAQYVTNTPEGGKYRQHKHFLKLLRSIEAYGDYLTQGAIVELPYQQAKTYWLQSGASDLSSLFQATGYQSLTLLNATAQVALSHHLDDEISKQMSVAANTTIARQATRTTGQLLPEETAVRKLEAFLQIGRLLKTPEHIVQQEAAKQIEVTTGVNLRPFLLVAPAQDNIAPEDEMLEPTPLAKRFQMPSGNAVNVALAQIGWQVRRIGGGWEPTPAGKPYAATHAYTAPHSTHSGYNVKWKITAVRDAFLAQGILQPPAQGGADVSTH